MLFRSKAQGALVAQLLPNSPAEAGGLKSGDIITAFNGQEINLSSDLPHRVGRIKPGTLAKLNIVRNGKAKVIELEIGALPDTDEQIMASAAKITPKENRLGVAAVTLNAEQVRQYGEGVMVERVEPGKAGALAGLVRGDVITMIHGQRITSVDTFNKVVEGLPKGRSVPMQIMRRGSAMFIPLRLQE